MKNSTDTIVKRTSDLPACSTVPQPTAPPRTPLLVGLTRKYSQVISQKFIFSDVILCVPRYIRTLLEIVRLAGQTTLQIVCIN
jgi:hypothetical protein